MLHLRNLKVIVWMLIIAICCFGGMATAGGPPAKKIGPNSDVQMRSASIGISGPIVGQADCSTITSGMCIDSDDHQVYRWDGDSVENLTGGGTDEIVYQANCATITNGYFIDTDNGNLFYWNGSAVVQLVITDDQTAAEVANTPR
nr:hypothetical protein [Desulfobacteraceae bacterium]